MKKLERRAEERRHQRDSDAPTANVAADGDRFGTAIQSRSFALLVTRKPTAQALVPRQCVTPNAIRWSSPPAGVARRRPNDSHSLIRCSPCFNLLHKSAATVEFCQP